MCLVGPVGIEPTYVRLKAWCTATMPKPLYVWSITDTQGYNQRTCVPISLRDLVFRFIITSLSLINLVELGGFEPPVFRLSVERFTTKL